LEPALGRAAFEADHVDAWSIWDPYLAGAQATLDLRVIADHSSVPETFGFYVASRAFADRSPKELQLLLEQLAAAGAWAVANPHAAAELLAPLVGLPATVVETWQRRSRYGVKAIDAAVIESQQQIADAFFQQRLIPKRINVADAVWRPL